MDQHTEAADRPEVLDGADLVHVHFGYEHRSPGQIAEFVAALRSRGLPLVVTVHDLTNPHEPDPSAHLERTGHLVRGAAAVITLTRGAAAEIRERWGVDAQVLPHPRLMAAEVTEPYRLARLDRSGGGVLTLLLVGVVLGLAFDSVSTFVQRILSPTDYDLLSLELFGRLSSVQPDHLPLALAVCAGVGAVVWMRRARLDVVLLGRDGATALGVDHRRELIVALVCVSILIAFATALAGPMTFFGFLVATLAYRLAGTHQHAFVLPMAVGLGVLALAGAQLVMRHVFDAAGLVTVIIEVVGGIVFLALLLGERRQQ